MTAVWITHPAGSDVPALFRKEFLLNGTLQRGAVRITAGRYFRLKINGVWLCDGPGRSVPGSASVDTLEVHSLLHGGRNVIEVTAVGALWAELLLEYADGSTAEVSSSGEWQTAALPLKLSDDTEFFDNRSSQFPEFQNACVPENEQIVLSERDCRMMTRREFLLSGFQGNYRLDSANNTVLPGEKEDVSDAEALIYPDFDNTTVSPAGNSDMLLVYTLPAESIGYWSLVLSAAEGTEVVISSGGTAKAHLICREGVNRYTTFTRFRGGRLELVLKNMKREVRIQSVRLAESTYPAVKGMFLCSDYKLTRAWETAERTLKLAMEDTFCDAVPWGPDCRNEILFALSSCGAYDLVRRTLKLGAESSCPAAWVTALEDYYNYTGDKSFVREMWHPLRKILDGQLANLSPSGLAGDVIADSFRLAGALGAADRLTPVAGDMEVSYGQARQKLLAALAAVWDARFLAWPDTPFEGSSYSVATNVLAVLADAVPEELLPMTRSNVLSPRPELRLPGTAEEKMNRFLALEKLGSAECIIPELLEEFSDRLDSGCTTFGSGNASEAMLLYFIARLVFGVQPQADGTISLSVVPSGLTWARGNFMTPAGAVDVRWHLEEKKVKVSCHAPAGLTVHIKEE